MPETDASMMAPVLSQFDLGPRLSAFIFAEGSGWELTPMVGDQADRVRPANSIVDLAGSFDAAVKGPLRRLSVALDRCSSRLTPIGHSQNRLADHRANR
jgi:hypothetical protein